MKRYKLAIELAGMIGLAILAFVALSPDSPFMPDAAQMVLLAVVFVLISTFLVLFWRQRPVMNAKLTI